MDSRSSRLVGRYHLAVENATCSNNGEGRRAPPKWALTRPSRPSSPTWTAAAWTRWTNCSGPARATGTPGCCGPRTPPGAGPRSSTPGRPGRRCSRPCGRPGRSTWRRCSTTSPSTSCGWRRRRCRAPWWWGATRRTGGRTWPATWPTPSASCWSPIVPTCPSSTASTSGRASVRPASPTPASSSWTTRPTRRRWRRTPAPRSPTPARRGSPRRASGTSSSPRAPRGRPRRAGVPTDGWPASASIVAQMFAHHPR